MVYFTVVNNPLDSQFDVACIDKLISTQNTTLVCLLSNCRQVL